MPTVYVGQLVWVDGFRGRVVAYVVPADMGRGDLVWVECFHGARVDAVPVASGRVRACGRV